MEEQKFLEMALPGAGLSKYPTWRTVLSIKTVSQPGTQSPHKESSIGTPILSKGKLQVSSYPPADDWNPKPKAPVS